MKVSIVIPTYNEVENIGVLLEAIASIGLDDLEVIVVDDNSTDGTADVVRAYSKKYAFIKLIERPGKLGLGSAYKDGFKASSGDFVVTMDADLSHDPRYIPLMIEAAEKGADIVLGSRYIPGGMIVGWGIKRKAVSRVANALARLILGLNVRDATTGFRLYRREAFKAIAERSKCSSYAFQVEALYIARGLGLKVAEVPITFTDRRRGKSKLGLREILNFAWTLLKLRLM